MTLPGLLIASIVGAGVVLGGILVAARRRWRRAGGKGPNPPPAT